MFWKKNYKRMTQLVLMTGLAMGAQLALSVEIQGWTYIHESVHVQASPHDQYAQAIAQGDFNGDGYDDLAVGIPWMEFWNKENAGAVQVIYGSDWIINEGLLEQLIFDLPDVNNTIQKDALFGSALATGDFNADGYDDLIVGAPHFSGNEEKSGAVTIIYGSVQGLEPANMHRISSDTPYVPGYDETGDSFGRALTTGDFNNDGYDDVAIGHPLEDNYANGVNNSIINGGAITVLSGSFQGLSGLGAVSISQSSLSYGVPEHYDMFGWSLTSGDYNNDGYDDLLIGVPYEDFENIRDTGSIIELKGSVDGVTTQNYEVFFQGQMGMVGKSETGDAFGFALETGDFNGDGYDDVIIGIPYEDKSKANAGAVTFINGNVDGLERSSSYGFSNASLPGGMLHYKKLGQTVTTGDFNSDGYDDVVIAAPGDSVTIADIDYVRAGSLVFLFGKNGDINPNSAEYIENIFPQDNEEFGFSLAIGDYNGDAFLDIAIGTPKSKTPEGSTGRVLVYYLE